MASFAAILSFCLLLATDVIGSKVIQPQAPQGGPNVCTGSSRRTQCCPGWTMRTGSALCVVPICVRPCGGRGRCVRPNLCLCEGGSVAASCDTSAVGSEVGDCGATCLNGGTCVDRKCVCRPGFSGAFCGEPICTEACQNGGRCIGPDRCACVYGFAGRRCESDYRTGPCFRRVRGGATCERPLRGVVCTRMLCCATVGVAWGQPCQQCPATLPCEPGLMGKPCKDVDECEAIPNVCGNARCVNTLGSFRCECARGYVMRGDQDGGGACVDVDECAAGACANGRCVNVDGDFYCACASGFIASPDRKFCIDSHQGRCYRDSACSDALPVALTFAECCCSIVTSSSDRGWIGDAGSCRKCPIPETEAFRTECGGGGAISPTLIDECGVDTSLCRNGRCIDLERGFRCECDPGYVTSGDACVDVDECTENGKICLNGRCENAAGSYRCTCNRGFELSPDGSFCLDRDECRSENGTCTHGRCVNVDGDFRCVCDPGFRLAPDGHVCIDVDECRQVAPPPCSANAHCVNNQGSFRCQCESGFTLAHDQRTCIDSGLGFCYRKLVSPGTCADASPTPVTRSTCCCSAIASETLHWGAPCEACPDPDSLHFRSLCARGAGHVHDGKDIDECALYPDACGRHGTCENLPGDFRCVCEPGFVSTGRACADVDECVSPGGACVNGRCRNVPGSFHCDCAAGFAYDAAGGACVDADECAAAAPPCVGGRCMNVPGSFRCECDGGATLDVATGRVCLDFRLGTCWTKMAAGGACEGGAGRAMRRDECCSATLGVAWGSPCAPCAPSHCPPGRAPSVAGNGCDDIDECELFPEVACGAGAFCVNADGSFRCSCAAGFAPDATGRRCIDERTGSCFLEYRDGRCLTPLGGAATFRRSDCCCARAAAWGSELSCEACPREGSAELEQLCGGDVGLLVRDECALFPGVCANGRCVDADDGFRCACNAGYAVDRSGFNCTDIDECVIARDVCGGGGTCVNVAGTFRCACAPGFDSGGPLMPQCMDVDECQQGAPPCRGGACVNVPGSFRCECPPGHELDPQRHLCADIDECSRTSSVCAHGACENLPGGYACSCDAGFRHAHSQTSCVDVDECSATTNGGCSDLCANTAGSFHCACADGYALLPDGRTCADVDECSSATCAGGGTCINLPGSFRCTCATDGSVTPAPDGRACLDVDECVLRPEVCAPNGTCVNVPGSFRCACEPGFSATPEVPGCRDDDECASGRHRCDRHALCVNAPGSYACRCRDGFRGDGFACHDVNECAGADNGGCSGDAACVNVPGSFRCACDVGFSGDGVACVDVDECSAPSDVCRNGRCLNYPGDFRCDCDMGFVAETPQQRACVDIDECATFHNICVFGTCENALGAFRCVCDSGFVVDATGGNCTDVDECGRQGACRQGTCVNVVGSFRCECGRGYEATPDGADCVDRRQGTCHADVACSGSHVLGHATSRQACCCTSGAAWADQATRTCDACPSRNTTDFRQLCPEGAGFVPDDVTVVFGDVDECVELPGTCGGGAARCVNTFGSFTCACADGFRFDERRRSCVDVDECGDGENACGSGSCVNVVGSFTCVCPEGHALLSNGAQRCVDVRKQKCFRSVAPPTDGGLQCSDATSGLLTRVACCCTVGSGWGAPCERCPLQSTAEYRKLCPGPGMATPVLDIDECIEMTSLCGDAGSCVNTLGSFRCHCASGFRYDAASYACIDVDECVELSVTCHGSSECENVPGSFRCACPRGFRLGADGRDCDDVDECSEGACGADGDCVNFRGGFQCVCHRGFYLTSSRDLCLDIDECARIIGACGGVEAGACVNVHGSFRCACSSGFELSPNNDCVDVDECRTLVGGACRRGRCRNTRGSYACECPFGFRASADARGCVDVDECVEVADACGREIAATCVNTDGSFACTCPSGYEADPERPGCRDVDECAQQLPVAPCGGGACVNLPGSFSCTCPPGFRSTRDGRACVDERRGTCYTKRNCSEPLAHPLTRAECCCSSSAAAASFFIDACVACPLPSSVEFALLCPGGVGFVPGFDGLKDVDECASAAPPCDYRCVNTDGSFRCECKRGYELAPDGRHCLDDDECARADACGGGDGGATCINAPGSFRCTCARGFVSLGASCRDVDECADDACAFRCQNLVGSFRCVCPYGYALAHDQRHCQDVDECAAAHECRYDCKNLVGSYRCVCASGYVETSDGDCVDMDECATVAPPCRNGRCVNVPGTFRCDCDNGFGWDDARRRCVDRRVDTCYHRALCRPHPLDVEHLTKADCCCGTTLAAAAWGRHCDPCPARASEAFGELCPHGPGFGLDGRDVDECATARGLCRNGRCVNTDGGFRCVCAAGYAADANGTRCHDIDECATGVAASPCDFRCVNADGSFRCACASGFVIAADGRTCVDVDECGEAKHNCSHSCENTPGSFRCRCLPGFLQSGALCVDVNECALAADICGDDGAAIRCVNTQGSFRCVGAGGATAAECPDGFVRPPGWSACVDVDECGGVDGGAACGPAASCRNSVGGFDCACPRGYQFDQLLLACLADVCDDCAFGCGSRGDVCACPDGYHSIGRGHCLSSVGGATIDGFPLHPLPPDDVIGTEACFSCQTGNRRRRSVAPPGNVTDDAAVVVVTLPERKRFPFPFMELVAKRKSQRTERYVSSAAEVELLPSAVNVTTATLLERPQRSHQIRIASDRLQLRVLLLP